MPRPAAPDLTIPLAQPITLTRGPRSHLVTLMDAAILIRDLEPFRRARPVWDRAVTIIPLHFWAIVLMLLFMWIAFGLGGLVVTALGLALIMARG